VPKSCFCKPVALLQLAAVLTAAPSGAATPCHMLQRRGHPYMQNASTPHAIEPAQQAHANTTQTAAQGSMLCRLLGASCAHTCMYPSTPSVDTLQSRHISSPARNITVHSIASTCQHMTEPHGTTHTQTQ
jgi:hypothetical protein